VEQAALELDVELVAVEPLLKEVAELVEPQCSRRGATISIQVDPAMPPLPMDANAMHQALMNLATNAIDAVPERGGRVLLAARHLPNQESAEISVSDNGQGVAAEVRERIFEPFVSTKGQRGTGWGWRSPARSPRTTAARWACRASRGREAPSPSSSRSPQPEEEKGRTRAPRPGADLLEGRME
jgi:hypothetical protein